MTGLEMSADGNQEDRDPAAEIVPGRLRRAGDRRSGDLAETPVTEIAAELVQRIGEDPGWFSEVDADLISELHDRLGKSLDTHENRFSYKRYRDLFSSYYESLGSERPALEGATFIELGCGGLNPAGFMFLLLALGLSRGVVVDLDPVEDTDRASRALADVASRLLTDPPSLLGEWEVTPEEVLRNLASFDLRALTRGDPAGVDSSRLSHVIESASELSIEDESVDYIFSNSFFEHLPDPAVVIEEAYRIMRPGGLMAHGIDFSDHDCYVNPAAHPLDFLATESTEKLVNISNRLRLSQFQQLFEDHGFRVVSTEIYRSIPVDEALRSSFVDPYSSMPKDDLSVLCAKITMRRKA